MTAKRQAAFQILAVLMTLAPTLVLDYGVKQAYWARVGRPAKPTVAHRSADVTYHHGLKPNAAVTDVAAGYQYPFFSNSLGMRDAAVREVSLRSPGPRILFIGDSFTEGIGLPWEETFAGRVQAALAPEGVEVLNAGVNSYCPVLIKRRLRDLVENAGLEVDRVVVLIDISDIVQELQYRETPAGSIEAIPYAPFAEQAAALQRANQLQDWLQKNIEENFVLLGAISRNLRLWWRARDATTSLWDQMGEWAWNWPDYEGPHRTLVDQGLRSAAANLEAIAVMLRARGIGLTVVVYPWPQQLKSPVQPNEAERFWGEWARQQGVDFISLYPRFRELGPATEVREKYYFPSDCHWNAAGHAEVAQVLLGPCRSQILPPKKSTLRP